jgi:hypothetical protein
MALIIALVYLTMMGTMYVQHRRAIDTLMESAQAHGIFTVEDAERVGKLFGEEATVDNTEIDNGNIVIKIEDHTHIKITKFQNIQDSKKFFETREQLLKDIPRDIIYVEDISSIIVSAEKETGNYNQSIIQDGIYVLQATKLDKSDQSLDEQSKRFADILGEISGRAVPAGIKQPDVEEKPDTDSTEVATEAGVWEIFDMNPEDRNGNDIPDVEEPAETRPPAPESAAPESAAPPSSREAPPLHPVSLLQASHHLVVVPVFQASAEGKAIKTAVQVSIKVNLEETKEPPYSTNN